ncbi:uncharacterized protein LOC141592949 [Silene latifolia]|uniref:uncharacterized protein LOC141592949 n=1 Tax=Silene latifolia TaxID=37657 RepID=UPI003D772AFC
MAEEKEAIVAAPSGAPSLGNSHVSKRSLRNKSLSVSFDEKDLKDFVGGFQKRKKKRRKEAYRKQEEAGRRKHLEIRKQRRKEKENALYGGAPPPEKDGEADDEDTEQNDESELIPSVSEVFEGTTTYENGDVMVTVTTSDLTRKEEEDRPLTKSTSLPPAFTKGAGKQHNIPVRKKKPMKKVRKGSSRPKLQNKRERRKGNKKK